MRPWKLDEITYATARHLDVEVAVLPFGCTEPHNLHLPYGTDTLEADAIGERACAAAHDAGAKVMLLPTIPYGTTTNQRECAMSMNVSPSTLALIVGDLVESLEGHGVTKLLLLNSHGGNDLKPILRELYDRTPVRLFLCDWFRMIGDVYDTIFDKPEDHAGEMETSLALAFFPDLVDLAAAGDGATHPTRFDAVNKGWVSITRPWHLLTETTGSGDPRAATAEKGQRIMDVIVKRLSSFLVELSNAEIDEQFPF